MVFFPFYALSPTTVIHINQIKTHMVSFNISIIEEFNWSFDFPKQKQEKSHRVQEILIIHVVLLNSQQRETKINKF